MGLGNTVAKNVKALRIKAGLSQGELAKRTRLTVRYLSRLENSAPNVTLDVIERLAKGFGCDAGELLHDEKLRPTSKKVSEELSQAIQLLESVRARLEA